MSYRIEATASEKYLCAYRCHQCGEVVFPEGEIQGTAMKTTMFRPSVEDHAQVRAEAAANANANFRKLLDKVNNHQEFDVLNTWGQCSKCGAASAWKVTTERKHPEKPLEILAYISFAVWGGSALLNLSGWLVVAGLILMGVFIAIAVWLGKKAQNEYNGSNNQKIRKVLSQNTQWNCFPYVMMKGEMPSPEQLLSKLYNKNTTV